MIDQQSAMLALRAQLLTVSQLPALRAWELIDFTPTSGQPYLADAFVPATQRLVSVSRNGTVEETGLYVLTWHGLSGVGRSAIAAGVQAVLEAFPPGATFASQAGDTIRVRSDTGPYAGQIIPVDGGWAVCTIRIPWRAYSANLVLV